MGAQIFGDGSSYDNVTCANIDSGAYNETQEYVQETVATMNLVTMLAKSIPPIIFALFIGPWSDKFGRKFLIVFPLIGYVLYDVWFLINVIYFDFFSVDWLMLEFMQYWAGGYMCFFLGLYSYASDVSDESTRTVRIAVVDFVFFSGLSIGKSAICLHTFISWLFALLSCLFTFKPSYMHINAAEVQTNSRKSNLTVGRLTNTHLLIT